VAWLLTVAANRAIDRLRRTRMGLAKQQADADGRPAVSMNGFDDKRLVSVGDERLSLIFTCCHPALAEQARVAAVHAQAPLVAQTDWSRVAALYDQLLAVTPSPVVALNHAVAVAMATDPSQGLALIDRIDGLDRYHLLHAARADLLRRLGRVEEAAAAYRRAHELAVNPADRRFLAGRLLALGSAEFT